MTEGFIYPDLDHISSDLKILTVCNRRRISFLRNTFCKEKRMKIILKNLTKKFPGRGRKSEDVIAVNNFDFEIPDGKLIGLLGPSGCGKVLP